MKSQVVGEYEIGYECVRLVLRDGEGAEFELLPGGGGISAITIGCDDANWSHMVARLLHESFEFVSSRLGCRYYPSGDIANNSAAYVFMLNHQQFADCCAKVADFASIALPDFQKAWRGRRKLRAQRRT